MEKRVHCQDLQAIYEWVKLIEIQLQEILEDGPGPSKKWEELDRDFLPSESPPTLH